MIDVRPDHLDLIKQIFREHLSHCEIWAFGSRVKGKAKTYSDLDLVVVGHTKTPLKIMFQLKDEFAESELPFRVDLIDWNVISEDFRGVIKQGYEVLCSL